MEYMKYTQVQQKVWDDAIEHMTCCPFNLTSAKIEFDIEYSKNILENESFLIKEGKKILSVVGVYVEETGDGKRKISWNGGYCPGICINTELTYQEQERLGKKIMKYIDEVAEKYRCDEIWLRLDPLINPEQKSAFYNYNFLLKYNYIDNSSLTQIIDLKKSEKMLVAEMRKGHKSDIKRGRKYDIEFYDAKNIGVEQIRIYKSIYEKDAGKVTRNSELYMHYLHFIKYDLGALALAKYKEEYVAVLIVNFFHKTAYYSSYAELTEQLEGDVVGHRMQWEMIQYLKNRGIESYEMGEQVFGKTHYSCPDKKLINISNFKRGFGGYTAPFWRGRKIREEVQGDLLC